MKRFLSVIAYVLCAFFAVILIINTTLIVKSLANEDEIPDVFGYFPLVVLSDSMIPTLQSGDLVIYQKMNLSNMTVGDVVAFYDPSSSNGDSIVTHRIVEIVKNSGQNEYKTKGDANNTNDSSLIANENIVGIYKFRIPKIGNAVLFMQTTKGMLICIVIPLVLIMLANSSFGKEKTEKAAIEKS
jgi:signal peptidase